MSIGYAAGQSQVKGVAWVSIPDPADIPGTQEWWAKIHAPPSPSYIPTAQDVAYGEWWMLELLDNADN